MSHTEYKAYEARVAAFMERNTVQAGCYSPKHEGQEFFSWRACECCASTKGGTRETYLFVGKLPETFEADICTDCVYYLAYGVLDDMTMMDLTESN